MKGHLCFTVLELIVKSESQCIRESACGYHAFRGMGRKHTHTHKCTKAQYQHRDCFNTNQADFLIFISLFILFLKILIQHFLSVFCIFGFLLPFTVPMCSCFNDPAIITLMVHSEHQRLPKVSPSNSLMLPAELVPAWEARDLMELDGWMLYFRNLQDQPLECGLPLHVPEERKTSA